MHRAQAGLREMPAPDQAPDEAAAVAAAHKQKAERRAAASLPLISSAAPATSSGSVLLTYVPSPLRLPHNLPSATARRRSQSSDERFRIAKPDRA